MLPSILGVSGCGVNREAPKCTEAHFVDCFVELNRCFLFFLVLEGFPSPCGCFFPFSVLFFVSWFLRVFVPFSLLELFGFSLVFSPPGLLV